MDRKWFNYFETHVNNPIVENYELSDYSPDTEGHIREGIYEIISDISGIIVFEYNLLEDSIKYWYGFSKLFNTKNDHGILESSILNDFIPKDLLRFIRTSCSETYLEERDVKKTMRLIINGVVKYFECDLSSKALKYNGANDNFHFLFVMKDVTDREVLLKELERRNRELSRFDEIRNRMVAIAAHELRTPASTIEMIAGSLEKEEVINNISHIVESSRNLLRTIDDMKYLVDGDYNFKIKNESFTPQEIENYVVNNIESTLTTMNLNIEFNNKDENIHLNYVSDQYRIKNSILNVVKNACFHSKCENIKVNLDSLFVGDKKFLIWRIVDDGVGLDPNFEQSIFSFKKKSSKSLGSGVGLYLTKKWLIEIGGDIDLVYTGEKGTCFEIYVPVSLYKISDESRLVNEVDLKSLRVLLVDDDNVIRKITKRILAPIVKKIDTADSARNGLKYLRDNDYDFILSDYFMPEMNGLEFAKRVKLIQHDLPVAIFTAAIVGTDEISSNSKYVDLFETKPISKNKFIEVANILLGNKKPH